MATKTINYVSCPNCGFDKCEEKCNYNATTLSCPECDYRYSENKITREDYELYMYGNSIEENSRSQKDNFYD